MKALVAKLGAVLAALVIAMFVVACGGGEDEAADEPAVTAETSADAGSGESAGPDQEIVAAYTSDVATLDPQKASDFGRDMLLWRVYEELVKFDNEGNPQPLLAAELPERVNDTTWEVKLVEGVEFSDGQPFNADSAVYSINRMVSEDYATQYPEVVTIAGANKVDEYTIRVKTHEPDPIFIRRLKTIKMIPEEHGDLEKEAIGTGPYMLEEYNPGSGGVIVYNPNYRGEKPQVTKVTYRIIPDASTRSQALAAGEVDIVPNVPPDEADSAPKLAVASQPTGAAYFRLNTVSGPFTDVRLREAVNLAVDREGIVDALFNGGEYAVPATCQGAPITSEAANQSLEPPPYDPERAAQLVEEAGAVGTEIDIVSPTDTYAQDRDTAQVVAQSLEAIGLKPNLSIEDYNSWFDKIYATQGDAPHMTFAETTDNLGHIARITSLLYSSEGPVSAYNDPKMDRLLNEAFTELDDDRRQELYDELLKYGCDEYMAVFMYDRRDLYGMADRIVFEPGIELPPRIDYDAIEVVNP